MQQIEEKEERQKQFIIEYSKLGMDFYSACVAAECNQDQISRFQQDEVFQHDVEFAVRFKEKELLDRLNKVAMTNANRGDTKALERLLEILNPDQYSKTTKLAHSVGRGKGKAPASVKIEFVGSSEADDY